MKQSVCRARVMAFLMAFLMACLAASVGLTVALGCVGPAPNGTCLLPGVTEEKDAGYAAWSGGGASLPTSVTVTNVFPLQISNDLICRDWPAATTTKTAKVVVLVRQVETDNYGTWAVVSLYAHNEQGGLRRTLKVAESQHITSDLVAMKYPIGEEWTWGPGGYAAVTIVSDLVSDATVEVAAVWVEE